MPPVSEPVTALERVMVPGEVIAVIVALFPIPLPLTTMPSANPVKLLIPVMVVVPLVVPVRSVEVDT